MNAQTEIDRLLEESGAVLVRQNKHLVYRLPNGKNFVVAKTPSDPDRGAKNSLSDLRRALGAPRTTASQEPTLETQQEAPPERQQSRPPEQPEDLSVQGQGSTLRSRLESMIVGEEAAQELLMSEAQQLERRVHMLKALLPYVDDPATEAVLQAIASPPHKPPAALLPEPPQQITERVQVTRQLVFAATQTFEDTFTVNDVADLMTGDRKIEGRERVRVRQAVAQAMITLNDRGELVRVKERSGRRPSTWRKSSWNDVGTRA
jgi:hypothetical protein